MAKEKDQERYYPQLENIVRNLMDSIDDFMSLIIAVSSLSLVPEVRLSLPCTNNSLRRKISCHSCGYFKEIP